MHKFDLKLFRKSIAKLSQEAFATKIGFSKGTIGKIEAGYASITDNMLHKIEAVFETDLSIYKSYYTNSSNTSSSIIAEQISHYNAQNSLVGLLKEYGDKLDSCYKEKEDLLKRISELEKELLKHTALMQKTKDR